MALATKRARKPASTGKSKLAEGQVWKGRNGTSYRIERLGRTKITAAVRRGATGRFPAHEREEMARSSFTRGRILASA